MSERVVAIVQARLNSSRFPRKVLADIHGAPMIAHVLRGAARIVSAGDVVLTVPLNENGQIQSELAGRVRVQISCGPHPDLLASYWLAARETHADVIVRVTGDCPAVEPGIGDRVVRLLRDLRADYASNDTRVSGYPDGFDVEVFTFDALDRAHVHASDPADREHVGPWMQRNLRCGILYAPEPWTGPKKLSVDTPEDLEVVKEWLRTHPLT